MVTMSCPAIILEAAIADLGFTMAFAGGTMRRDGQHQ